MMTELKSRAEMAEELRRILFGNPSSVDLWVIDKIIVDFLAIRDEIVINMCAEIVLFHSDHGEWWHEGQRDGCNEAIENEIRTLKGKLR